MKNIPPTTGNVTVEEALRKGKWQLMYVPLLLMLLLIAATGVGVYLLPDYDGWLIGFAYCILSLLAICFLPLVHYYIMLPRWRIWAYTNVRNVHELKQKAILARILYEDDSFFMRFQVMNEQQKEQLGQLQYKFEQRDEFVDDLAVPFETVFTSEKNLRTGIILPFVFLAAAAVMFFFGEYRTAIICIVVTVVIVFLHFRTSNRLKGAKLVLSNEGITTNDAGYHPWQVVHNERVHVVGGGESTSYWLAMK